MLFVRDVRSAFWNWFWHAGLEVGGVGVGVRGDWSRGGEQFAAVKTRVVEARGGGGWIFCLFLRLRSVAFLTIGKGPGVVGAAVRTLLVFRAGLRIAVFVTFRPTIHTCVYYRRSGAAAVFPTRENEAETGWIRRRRAVERRVVGLMVVEGGGLDRAGLGGSDPRPQM